MSQEDRGKVLVIDDEENMRLVLDNILVREGYRVALAGSGAEALQVLDNEPVDFILCDVRMPVMDGLAFLSEARARRVRSPIIMMSAYGTVDSAVEAMKAGAFDYIFKPFKPDEILLTLKKADQQERLRRENLALRRAAGQEGRAGLVARSKSMKDLLIMVERVAAVKSPVLITGESGTGKELVARAIHAAGDRSNNPFVAVNCGAIPENLLESELFGHVRGAFTDAVRDKSGLFREADGGVLFLDEIGELPPSLQVKLLRALQEDEVRPLGATAPVKVDVRILAATAKDLSHEVKQGRFREDLFYRLNVLPLTIPPLRDRPEDIPLLLDHFLVIFASRMGRRRPEVTREFIEALENYAWPGNVRELENLVERTLVLCPKPFLDQEDLPDHLLRTESVGLTKTELDGSLNMRTRIRELEADIIKEALIQTGGNRSEAARRLGISYPSLLSKIKLYGLTDD